MFRALTKALRAHQLYLRNNPVYQKAIETLNEAFRRVWESSAEPVVLEVSESELRCEGKPVYSQASRTESIAWVLFKDGVRSITFLAGVEEEEIVGLLDVLHRARTLQADANDDLLTLLWEKDFQRFRYVFQDLVSDAAETPLPTAAEITPAATAPVNVASAVKEEAPQDPGLARVADLDASLYFLDEKEIEYLHAAVREEYAQDLRRNVLSILFDVLELQPYATVRAELISIVESFLPYLLGAADFSSVVYVLREAKAVLLRARELSPEHRRALEELPARLSEEQTLAQLLQSLDEATLHPTADELGELFGELRQEALPTLLGWLTRLTNARVRDVVETAIQRLAAAHPPKLVEAMRAADPGMVLEAVKLSGRLKLELTVPALGAAVGHAEPAIRVAAVQALAQIASAAALQALEPGLDDADREVRLTSVRVISQHRFRAALPRVAAVVQGKSVRAADLTEKMAFFEAYGLLVGDEGVAALDAVLNRGGFLKRKEDPQTRACAAMALGRIGSPAARTALEQASADKEALVRSAVGRALRGLPGAGGGAEA
ncbi:MAG: HEAT repeat domain-containing protein [Gemmatimonadetes bacterium]|nr:HEAT repeat domain-containing protein [Gemmatimonadota bacterium]